MKYFISYAREDQSFAARVRDDLDRLEIDTWFDQRDIPPGARWDEAVQAALRECGGMLLVLSPSSVSSSNVMDEASYAIDEGKHVVPLLHASCVVPFRLKRLQYVDFSQDYPSGLDQLQRALKTPGASIPPSRVPAEPAINNQGGPRVVRPPRWPTWYHVSVFGAAAVSLALWFAPIVKVDAFVAPENASISINGDRKKSASFRERLGVWDVQVTDEVEKSTRTFKLSPMDLMRAGLHPRPTWRVAYEYTFTCLVGQCPRPSTLTARLLDGQFDAAFEAELRGKGFEVADHNAVAIRFGSQSTFSYVPLLAGDYGLRFDGACTIGDLGSISVRKNVKHGIQVQCP